ncbi:MAG: peptidase M49, partial [Porphyromonadaceae bacterium]|nr:peptidase M49 [Porphyromonadaceae bacterium]
DAYKAEYYSYLHNGLVMQLVRIEPGHRIEEAHMRNRALISRYVLEHCEGAVELDGLNLKIYDYEPIRLAVAQLLREIQRIKSEGDSESAAQLIAQYAVDVPQHLHHTLLQKYQQLHIAPYKGFVNPKLLAVRDQEGKVSDIVPSYHEAYDEQMLRYSRDYSAKGANYDVSPWSIKDHEPSESILEEAKSIRKSLVTRMDGVVASNMREYGLSYKYNFGMTRSHLDDIAKKVKPSTQLAQYLWSREVRELRLIALRIWPTEEISSNELLSLALQCEGKAELADEFVALLMDRVPNAHYLAMTWIESGLDVVSVALNILTRTIRRKICKPNSFECDYLIRFAISMIEKYVVCDYYIPNAARNFLKSMVGVSKEIADDIIAGMEDLLQRDLRGEVLQIAEELKFESEFVYES